MPVYNPTTPHRPPALPTTTVAAITTGTVLGGASVHTRFLCLPWPSGSGAVHHPPAQCLVHWCSPPSTCTLDLCSPSLLGLPFTRTLAHLSTHWRTFPHTDAPYHTLTAPLDFERLRHRYTKRHTSRGQQTGPGGALKSRVSHRYNGSLDAQFSGFLYRGGEQQRHLLA